MKNPAPTQKKELPILPGETKQSGITPEPTMAIISRKGYFDRHFLLCRFEKTQQDAYDKVEEEYRELAIKMHLDKKQMFCSYDYFRKAKSNYYSDLNNR